MRTDDFDYELPIELIAQEPAFPRDSCRLLVLDRVSGKTSHEMFSDILDHFDAGDCLVINETRVLPARLHGRRKQTGGAVEVLLLKELEAGRWECLVKPGRKARPGDVLEFGDILQGTVLKIGDEGTREIVFTPTSGVGVNDAFHKLGEMPLPPYITKKIADPELYQTVFSHDEHSAAAPTAGLHFTEELMERARDKGIIVAKVRLDVGLGTFRPVSVDDPLEHHIHTEYYEVPQETVDIIEQVKQRGGRVIAVGTTATRALESAYKTGGGRLVAVGEATALYILPGYRFGVIDGLITNFHVPKSTLMMLVSAFSTREDIMVAYREAVALRYRMLSFGDAMLII